MDSEVKKQRVCVIGAGPAGMAALYYFAKLGADAPEVVCYEKSGKWGGQWNYSWRTGTDEHGETVCSGIYHNMWLQGPKEILELGHYTFEDHFGKNIQSFVSATVILNYLEGYWNSSPVDLSKQIKFKTPVYNVHYNSDTDDFTVVTKDVVRGKDNPPETFSHVIVATGHFTLPDLPEYKGFETFPGKIMHSHEFRDGKEFNGKRILLVGSSYSADDIALQCYKHGVSHVIMSWRTKPRGMKFPDNVEERPILTEVSGNHVTFSDGSTADVDAIILCTGYMYTFPFLEDNLRLDETLPSLHPDNLYKGIVWLKGGNNKLLYIGALKIIYSWCLFDAQAVWLVRYITGKNVVNPDDKTGAGLQSSQKEIQAYLDKTKAWLSTAVDEPSALTSVAKYFREIADDTGYQTKIEEQKDIYIDSLAGRYDHALDYKDFRFTSVFTRKKAPPPKTKWLESFVDTIDEFV